MARCMHSSKSGDSWFLYALHPVNCFTKEKQQSDQTLEILMTQLNPDVMQIFTKEQSANASQATQVEFTIFFSNNCFVNCIYLFIYLGFWYR